MSEYRWSYPGGALTGYSGGPEHKQRLLELEQVLLPV
ncbi:MGMT family protein [Nocardia sp. NBC_01388]